MARKRIPTGLSGILALDKPAGLTSHDVVNTVRRSSGERRVGHAGTLDPLATGLLLVCVGPATRLADYLMAGVKTYQVRICFGTATNTDDAEGQIIRRAPVGEELQDEAFAAQTVAKFLGETQQRPPSFSAIKQKGIKAYKAARAGINLELEARKVHLYKAEVLAIGESFWDLELCVSKGYYVRSFARDIGEFTQSAAHVGALRRIASGSVSVKEALPLASLSGEAPLPYINPVAALGLPKIELGTEDAKRVKNGMPLILFPHNSGDESSLFTVYSQGRLLALYEQVSKSGLLTPKVVIPGGISIA